MAYYRAAVRACEYDNWHWGNDYSRAIKQGFLSLATGSSFMHASHTWVGSTFDNDMIAVIIYTAYQAVMEKLGAKSNMLKYLGDDELMDARELMNIISKMPLH